MGRTASVLPVPVPAMMPKPFPSRASWRISSPCSRFMIVSTPVSCTPSSMVSQAARVGAMTTTRPSAGRPGYRSDGGVVETSTMRFRALWKLGFDAGLRVSAQYARTRNSQEHGQMGMMPESAATLVFTRASEVASCTGPPRGGDDADPAAVLSGAAVAVRGGTIVAVGPEEDLLRAHRGA